MKKLAPLLKMLVLVAIVTWLILDVRRNHPDTLSQLADQPKDWGKLGVAVVLCLTALGLGFYRWYLLVRALRIPFHFRDAIRLGMLGYLFNFVALGSTGGDVVKALLLAREQRGRRLEAVATIAVDRLFGLFGLLLVASTAICVVDLSSLGTEIRLVANSTLVLTGLGTMVMLLAMAPGRAGARLAKALTRLPKVGRPLERLILAFRMYRQQKGRLLVVGALSVSIHILMAFVLYFAAHALYAEVPTLLDHFIIVPLANVVGALPISPSGLGTFELAMGYLYDHVPTDGVGMGKGLVVALSYRTIQIGVACIGIVIYFLNRRQVVEALKESEHEMATT